MVIQASEGENLHLAFDLLFQNLCCDLNHILSVWCRFHVVRLLNNERLELLAALSKLVLCCRAKPLFKLFKHQCQTLEAGLRHGHLAEGDQDLIRHRCAMLGVRQI